MRVRRAVVGLLALCMGVGLLLAVPTMPGAPCLAGESTGACPSDATATTYVLFVAGVGALAAAVGGWNVIAAR